MEEGLAAVERKLKAEQLLLEEILMAQLKLHLVD